ncbi:MAG: hypothetical protein B7X99_02180 [Rhizobiales bacterium 17-65-6]|nr:MAG: hypothetical protein B7Y70_07605 [Rhizobiales bacterium 35-68-8]OZA01015.1 MAG: hypothetical protein B7X99_02180 [Rhizobiales bacterium 17-65-6]
MTSEPETPDTRPCILILDADVIVRHLIAEYLRTCGYRVAEAASAEEALSILSHADVPIDTVLMDMQAPGTVNGFALLRKIRETFPDVDVVPAGSAAKATEEAADLCEEGPHLSRPYEPQMVLEEIKRLIARRGRAVASEDAAS